jgi:ubiquinol-cytochrome c reductase cytochrome b subunit
VESGRIVRLPHGEYIEVHEPVDEYKRYKLVDFSSYEAIPAQPDARGKVSGKEKLRGRLSRFFFEDRVAPVTPKELEAAHHHESPAEVEAVEEDQTSITNR